MSDSELTFKEVAENLAYVQVWWNGKKVYDDYDDESDLETLKAFEAEYNNKIVHSMYIEIVEFHHCIIEVEGEDV